jgi:hypothetical protein
MDIIEKDVETEGEDYVYNWEIPEENFQKSLTIPATGKVVNFRIVMARQGELKDYIIVGKNNGSKATIAILKVHTTCQIV